MKFSKIFAFSILLFAGMSLAASNFNVSVEAEESYEYVEEDGVIECTRTCTTNVYSNGLKITTCTAWKCVQK